MGKNYSKKSVQKTGHPILLVMLVLFFVIGGVCGYFTYYKLTEKDKFVINGEREINLTVGETYTEEYASAICMGKDCSDKVIIEGTVDTSKEGVYILTYTIDNFRFKGVKRYRAVIVTEEGTNAE